MWKMFENIPALPIQRHARAKREIIIWSGDEMYNVPTVTHHHQPHPHPNTPTKPPTPPPTPTPTHPHLRHGMDNGYCRYFGDFCNSANSHYTSCIDFNIKNTDVLPVHIANRVTVNGNYGWSYFILFIVRFFLCPHCKVHLLVSKIITLKFTETTCCVDIVYCTWWKLKSKKRRASVMQTIQEQYLFSLL